MHFICSCHFVYFIGVFKSEKIYRLNYFGCNNLKSLQLINPLLEDSTYSTRNSLKDASEVSAVYNYLKWENKWCSKLSENSLDGMKFVFFFGYDRSGSTVTGRIIDAHPHALIANEFVLFDILADQLTGTR